MSYSASFPSTRETSKKRINQLFNFAQHMQQISTDELQESLANKKDLFLVDVRETSEHETFNIGGILIPLGEIVGKAQDIPTDRPVVVYCRRGVRSQIAIQRLEEKFGFTNLINLQGGLMKWKSK